MMIASTTTFDDLSMETQGFYRQAVTLLNEAGVPFLVGGAYSLAHYTGVVRHTKDFDVFVRPEHCQPALDLLRKAGCRTELTFSHWLGKAFNGEDFVDVIFSSGNGVATVDDLWFEHSQPATIFGEPVRLCPVEETIWSKSYVCERERFDGADVNHLILIRGRQMDWRRLLGRFGPHWRVLLAHLVKFGFVYPSERDAVPGWVMEELTKRLLREGEAPPGKRVCQGTLLSRTQYLIDIDHWGFADARQGPESRMNDEEIRVWDAAGVTRQ